MITFSWPSALHITILAEGCSCLIWRTASMPVHLRHHDVHEHDVRLKPAVFLDGLFAVGRLAHYFEFTPLKYLGDGPADEHSVIHHQGAKSVHGAFPPRLFIARCRRAVKRFQLL